MLPIVVGLAVAAPGALAGPIGYVLNFSGQFGTMDLSTGAFTAIGSGLANTPDGIAGAPGGPAYTVDGVTGHLLRIAANGAVTDVGDTGTGPNQGPNGISILGGLTNGSLFALDFSNRLYAINPAVGSLALLGTLSLPQQEDAYIGNMTTSFNGDAARLYYTLEISGGPNTTGPALFEIDPVTLQVTSTALTNLTSRIIGSGFIDGTLYGFTEFGDILTINTASGATSVAGQYDSGSTAANPGPPFTGVFGVVATPEPSSAILFAAGGFALWAARHRPGRHG